MVMMYHVTRKMGSDWLMCNLSDMDTELWMVTMYHINYYGRDVFDDVNDHLLIN